MIVSVVSSKDDASHGSTDRSTSTTAFWFQIEGYKFLPFIVI